MFEPAVVSTRIEDEPFGAFYIKLQDVDALGGHQRQDVGHRVGLHHAVGSVLGDTDSDTVGSAAVATHSDELVRTPQRSEYRMDLDVTAGVAHELSEIFWVRFERPDRRIRVALPEIRCGVSHIGASVHHGPN